MTLKRYVSNRDPSWTHILDSCLKEVGGRFLLRCNFDVSKLPVKIPAFYKDCLVSWSSLVKWTNETMDGVLEQTIWNNKFILIENKSVYYSSFISIGLVTIGDMLSRTGSFLGFDELRQKGVTPSEYLQWLGLVHSLPPEWHLLMKNVNSLPSCFTAVENKNLENVRVFLDGHSVDVKQLTSKKVYGSFIASRAKEPSSKVRFIEHFSDENLDWKTIYKIPFVSTIDTRTRIFQFRILHRILYTNSTLFKMKLTPSPLCTFCCLESESPEHIFYECAKVNDFWNDFVKWTKNTGLSLTNLNKLQIMLGSFEKSDDFRLLNHLLIIAKQTIFYCKQKKLTPNFMLFKTRVKHVIDVEKDIAAKKKKKLLVHLAKWNKIIGYV